MNDKEKLLRDYGRMCLEPNCNDCRIGKEDGFHVGCQRWVSEHPKEAAEAIEEWGAEHPVKTRQDVFLERYPNTRMCMVSHEIIDIEPCQIDSENYVYMDENCRNKISCADCMEKYWSQEVEQK